MKKTSLTGIIVFSIIYGLAHQGHCQTGMDLEDYCPESGEVNGWHSEYEPRVAKGDDLFLLINGGADIYLEYGFENAIFHSYKLQNGGSINLEIYQMQSPASAYGIYTFKSSNSGSPVDVGQDGWMEEYYLNFWKGNMLVTLIGLDTEKETLDGVVQLAKSIDEKIKISGKYPGIKNLLPKAGLRPNGITYLKGNLALFNQYLFDSRNIFGFNEGVRGDYDRYDLYILAYNNSEETIKWYTSAKKELMGNGLFHDIDDEENSIQLKDQDDQLVIIKPLRNVLVIFIGAPGINYNQIFDSLSME